MAAAGILLISLSGLVLTRPNANAAPAKRSAAQGEAARWYSVPNPALGSLRAVDMVSPDVAWAVTMEDGALPGEVLAFREDAWRVMHSQPDRLLVAIDMVSPTQGWAVGMDLSPPRSVLLPISAGVVGPSETSDCIALFGVALVSATEGWAVGGQGTGDGMTCILHLKDGRWTKVPSPGIGVLSGVEMVDAENGWAIGSKGQTLRYDDRAWREVPSPVSADATGLYLGMSLLDMDNGWAVGNDGKNMLKLTNGRWGLENIGMDVVLGGVDMLTSDLGFAAGRSNTAAGPVILRFQDGRWREEALSRVADLTGLLDVDMISPEDGWAVGADDTLRYGVEPAPTATPTVTMTAPRTATATTAGVHA
jgi:hypothetical protein